ncbi:kelch domain-containing protein [Marssonina coronariae]|uniref:Kelch domain-containing protein n=1 Tax=Diplocarpon coronariae TaxID=2795749 RepID=A0A218Z724_9HELO|nr:kelch domain-containing protein [Marssonina coronariae]
MALLVFVQSLVSGIILSACLTPDPVSSHGSGAVRTPTRALADGLNIASCPSNQSFSEHDGECFSVCPGTDLVGTTTKTIPQTTSIDSCTTLCSTTAGCTSAVYDTANLVCSIKAPATSHTLIWRTNQQFTVIRIEVPANPAVQGQWSDLIQLPVIPVAGFVVPQFPEPSRILFFASWAPDAFGSADGLTQFADYNFRTGVVSARTVASTKHDMFCPGISALGDGRIVIAGGSDAARVTIYDPATNNFTSGPDMRKARGYQSSVTTSEGKVFELGGSWSGTTGGKHGELTELPDAKTDPLLTVDAGGAWREDNVNDLEGVEERRLMKNPTQHAWLFAWKDGSVFQAGPSRAQNWYNTSGTGSSTPAGTRSGGDAMCGVNVMYEPGKILSAGGSQSYDQSPAVAIAHVTTITDPYTQSSIERVADMAYPRGFANGVVLPDGDVLVTGGQRKSMTFTDTDGILYAELFHPATKTWTTLAPAAVPRNYHSTSLLLPDATVWSGGGGMCYEVIYPGSTSSCDKSVDHSDGQIFSPPYLFGPNSTRAIRPLITTIGTSSPASPSSSFPATPTVHLGGTVVVTTDILDSSASLVLMRMGTATHSINTDQRRVPLTDVKVEGGVYTATLPAERGVLIVGFYYLFVVSEGGVPSLGRTVRVVQ